MEGTRFTRNRQTDTRSSGKCLAGNPTRPLAPVAAGFRLKRWNGNSDPKCRSVLVEIEIPCILLLINRNKNSQNSPK